MYPLHIAWRLSTRLKARRLEDLFHIAITRIWTARFVGHRDALRFLAALDGLDRNRMLHLLVCPVCRRRASRKLSVQFDQERAPSGAPPPRRRPQLEERVAETRRQLRRNILPLPADQRLPAIAATATLCEPVVSLALLTAAAEGLDDPASAEGLAGLAFETASRAHTCSSDERTGRMLGALWLLVIIRLRLGRIDAAETTYQQAVSLLREVPNLRRQRAGLLGALAQLRSSQSRLDEAAGLFGQAARIYAQLGHDQGEALSRVQLAFVYLSQDQPTSARPELELAHTNLDDELAPELAARATYALAYSYAAVNRSGLARQTLRKARALYPPTPALGEDTFRTWWRGRTLARLGHHLDALALLDGARRRLLAAGSLSEAASSTLDLLLVRVAVHRLEGLSALADDLTTAFGPVSEALRCAAGLGSLADLATKRSPRFAATAASLRPLLAEVPASEGRQDLIPSLHVIADRLLILAEDELTAGLGLFLHEGTA